MPTRRLCELRRVNPRCGAMRSWRPTQHSLGILAVAVALTSSVRTVSPKPGAKIATPPRPAAKKKGGYARSVGRLAPTSTLTQRRGKTRPFLTGSGIVKFVALFARGTIFPPQFT